MSVPANYLGYLRQGASLGNTALGGNSPLGTLGSGVGIYSGLSSGTPQGEAGAAIGAGKLANQFGAFGDDSAAAGSALGGAGGALGLYGGIKQGGVAGDTSAALGAAQVAAPIASAVGSSLAPMLAMAGPLGLAMSPVIMGMSTPAYSMNKNYYQNMYNTLRQGPGAGKAAAYSGDSSEGQQYSKYITALMDAQNTGDPVEHSILNSLGIKQDATPAPGVVNSILQQSTQSPGLQHRNPRMARGGDVKSKALRGKLRKLYEGSFADRPRHYDGGGYVDYFQPTIPSDYSGDYISSQYPQNMDWSQLNGLTLPSGDQSALQQALQNNTPSTGYDQQGNSFSVNENSNPVPGGLQEGSNPAYQLPNIQGLGGSSVLGAGGALSGLGSALGVSSMGQLLQSYGALAPLLAAALGGNKAASAPATPAGYGSIPSIATPTNTRSYTQPNVANWYTYGQGPEQSFFSNNQLPTVPGVSPGTGASPTPTPSATSPASSSMSPPPQPVAQAPVTSNIQPIIRDMHAMAQGGAFDSTQGDSYVSDPGHGDGTSDGIDAKLSGGEYVMDAGTVSTLGNGSNEAGARALDQLRQRVRKHAGKQLVKGKQFMKAKAPEAYLRGGAK